MTKTCIKCSETKPLDAFGVSLRNKDGRRNICKPCAVDYSRQHRATVRHLKQARQARAVRDGLIEVSKPESTTKQCSKCKEIKPLNAFPLRRRGGPRCNPCKACKLRSTNAWRDRNKDKLNAMARDRSKKPEYKASARTRRARWRRRYPEKQKAEIAKLRKLHRAEKTEAEASGPS